MEKEYRGMVIKNTMAGSIMKLFFTQLGRFFVSEMRIFTDVEEALQWLLAKMEENALKEMKLEAKGD